jgi:hypothetical protein
MCLPQVLVAELDFPREYSGCAVYVQNGAWMLHAQANADNGSSDWEGYNNLVRFTIILTYAYIYIHTYIHTSTYTCT